MDQEKNKFQNSYYTESIVQFNADQILLSGKGIADTIPAELLDSWGTNTATLANIRKHKASKNGNDIEEYRLAKALEYAQGVDIIVPAEWNDGTERNVMVEVKAISRGNAFFRDDANNFKSPVIEVELQQYDGRNAGWLLEYIFSYERNAKNWHGDKMQFGSDMKNGYAFTPDQIVYFFCLDKDTAVPLASITFNFREFVQRLLSFIPHMKRSFETAMSRKWKQSDVTAGIIRHWGDKVLWYLPVDLFEETVPYRIWMYNVPDGTKVVRSGGTVSQVGGRFKFLSQSIYSDLALAQQRLDYLQDRAEPGQIILHW